MKLRRPLALICIAAVGVCGALNLMAARTAEVGGDAPQGILIEAETNKPTGDNKIVEVEGASGGKAVTSAADWQIVFDAPLPAGAGFQIWIRHKNGPLALKINQDGKVQDNWIWKSPENWAWTDAGIFSREQLGERLRIQRERGDKPASLLDAVVFAPAAIKVLPPFEPDDQAAPVAVNATVDWNKTVGAMRPMLWGWNDYEVTDPQKANDPVYQKLLADLQPPLVRIHHGGFSDSWTRAQTKTWDEAKIKAGLEASTGFKGAKIMMNVSHWPGWLSDQSTLSPEKEDEFARLCGDLVKVLQRLNYRVDYWEMTNEYDEAYEKAGKLDDLWRLFNKIAVEVRRADSKAKVGGPALRWAKPLWVEGFFKNCGQNTDFFTWHNYASGDIYDSNEMVLDRPAQIAGYTEAVRAAAQKWAPNRKMEFFLSEFNIKWVWNPIERRHGNNIGALFQASTLRRIALANNGQGIDGVMLWHAKGNSYGFIGGDNEKRSPYYLYLWGTKYLTGSIANHSSDDEKSLEILPIIQEDKTRSLLLIAKANRPIKIPNGAALLPVNGGQKLQVQRIDAKGFSENIEMPKTGDWSLPGYSITLLKTAKE